VRGTVGAEHTMWGIISILLGRLGQKCPAGLAMAVPFWQWLQADLWPVTPSVKLELSGEVWRRFCGPKFQVYQRVLCVKLRRSYCARNSKYQTRIIGWSSPTFLCPQISNAKYISYRCMVRNLSNAFLDRFEWNQTV